MKHIKLYESFNNIGNLCTKFNISDYSLDTNGRVDVDYGNSMSNGVQLYVQNFWGNRVKLSSIPINFGKVTGYFYCYENKLITLENSPYYVGGDFNCAQNKLTTLLGGPKYVGGKYNCSKNNIRDVRGFPDNFEPFDSTGKLKLIIRDNPVYEIIHLCKKDLQPKFIKFLNEYEVIRNGDTIIESRLMDAFAEVGVKSLYKESFENYILK